MAKTSVTTLARRLPTPAEMIQRRIYVIRSQKVMIDSAVQMNVLIVRAFVRLREMLATHKDLARKIEDVERQQKEHGQQLAAVYSVVRRLTVPPRKRKRPIGFRPMS
jgi:hypothetical protein